MATTVMNSDECDIAHEARMLEEYGEEVKYAERNPQLVPAGKRPVAPCNKHVNGHRHKTVRNVARPSSSTKVIDSDTTDIPQCP